MGPWVISFGLFGTGLAYLHHVIAIRKMPHESIAIFAAGIGTGALAIILGFIAGQSPKPGSFVVLLGTSVYSAVVGPFLFLLLGLLMRIKGERGGRK